MGEGEEGQVTPDYKREPQERVTATVKPSSERVGSRGNTGTQSLRWGRELIQTV